jgi:hypothetical protein
VHLAHKHNFSHMKESYCELVGLPFRVAPGFGVGAKVPVRCQTSAGL